MKKESYCLCNFGSRESAKGINNTTSTLAYFDLGFPTQSGFIIGGFLVRRAPFSRNLVHPVAFGFRIITIKIEYTSLDMFFFSQIDSS